MPLLLAVHTVSNPSATVPFAVILLQDHTSNKKHPAELKCRQLVPTSGAKSCSLWDAPDADSLKTWLDEAINVDVTHEVCEVQEEFALGLGEIARARAAEKVVTGSKEVAEKTGRALGAAATTVGAQVAEVDHKLRISERATAAGTAIKESAVGQTTARALTRVGTALGAGTKKVLENEKVHTATEAVGTSFKKLGASLSSLTGRRSTGQGGEGGGAPAERTPQFVQDEVTYDAPSGVAAVPPQPPTDSGSGGAGNARNPPAAAAAAPPPPSTGAAPAGNPPSRFALDDSEP